jgi:hypothetical protein
MSTHTDDASRVGRADRSEVALSTLLRSAVVAVLTCAIATLVVFYARFGADWPAQDFRAYVARHGLSVWTNSWYAGSALPGYSVLYPPLAALIGSSAVGVVSATAAAAFGALLAPQRTRVLDGAFCAAVMLCVLECLVIGQTTFLLGAAFGAAALAALRDGRHAATAVAAAGCSLASPLAGLFLIMGGLGLSRSYGWRRVARLAPGLLGAAVAAVMDSGGGPFTYRLVTLGAISLFCGIALALTDRSDAGLRDFACWYLLIAAAAFVVANPVGANLNRLGKLVALPLAIFYLATRTLPTWRRIGVVAGIGLAAWWSLIPLVTAVRWGAHDPGRDVAYYRGLLGYLSKQDPTAGRIEIPFTRTHTEAYWVGRSFPLARGWERQVDLGENDVLYSRLSAASYRRWLDDHAVSMVGVSTLEPDIGGQPEVDLLRHPPSYLRPAWHDRHWRVWRVVHPTPLADGPARVTSAGQASVELRFREPGSSLLRVRASPMWMVDDGDASLTRTSDGWLRVRTDRAGDVTLHARLTWALLDPANDLR